MQEEQEQKQHFLNECKGDLNDEVIELISQFWDELDLPNQTENFFEKFFKHMDESKMQNLGYYDLYFSIAKILNPQIKTKQEFMEKMPYSVLNLIVFLQMNKHKNNEEIMTSIMQMYLNTKEEVKEEEVKEEEVKEEEVKEEEVKEDINEIYQKLRMFVERPDNTPKNILEIFNSSELKQQLDKLNNKNVLIACLLLIKKFINSQNKLHKSISWNSILDCIIKSNILQETIKIIKIFLIASKYPVFDMVGVEPSNSRLEDKIVEKFQDNEIITITVQLNIEYLFDIYAMDVNPKSIFYILNEMRNEFEEDIDEMDIEDKNKVFDIITSIDGFKGLYQIAELNKSLEEGKIDNIDNFIDSISDALSVRL